MKLFQLNKEGTELGKRTRNPFPVDVINLLSKCRPHTFVWLVTSNPVLLIFCIHCAWRIGFFGKRWKLKLPLYRLEAEHNGTQQCWFDPPPLRWSVWSLPTLNFRCLVWFSIFLLFIVAMVTDTESRQETSMPTPGDTGSSLLELCTEPIGRPHPRQLKEMGCNSPSGPQGGASAVFPLQEAPFELSMCSCGLRPWMSYNKVWTMCYCFSQRLIG